MPNSRAWPWRSALQRTSRVVAWASARDLWFCVPFLAVVLALVFRPVLAQSGWPMNQEVLSWKYRLAIYAAHARRFDFFPIWSESMALGLGAPAPILYHKLFYLFALPPYLLSGSVKAAMTVTLGGFSVLGVLGASSLCRFLGVPPRAALIAAATLAFCNYAYTDWLVRGAFAEYSAMMLLPWLFRWCAGVLEGEQARRLARSGALIFPALYLAHAVLFFFAAPLVFAAVVWRLAGGPDRKAFLRALLVIGGVFALIAAPIVVCQLYVVRELEFKEGIAVFSPAESFSTLTEHLTGGTYIWGDTWNWRSVQLDLPLLVSALAGVTALALRLRPQVRRSAERAGARASTAASTATATATATELPPLRSYAGCWLAAAYYGFLLSPISAPVYDHVPGFSALQFPWRLLAFLSVVSVTLAAVPLLRIARLGSWDRGSSFAWMLLLVTYVCSPWMHEIRYEWLSEEQVEGPAPAEIQAAGFEYHPRVEGVAGRDLVAYASSLRPAPTAERWARASYSVERQGEPHFESGLRSYRVSAEKPCSVVLPIAYSPFIHVHTAGHAAPLPTHRTASDPRLHVDVSAGVTELEIQFPTLFSFYWDLLTRGDAVTPPVSSS